jgi:hypothetical protein
MYLVIGGALRTILAVVFLLFPTPLWLAVAGPSVVLADEQEAEVSVDDVDRWATYRMLTGKWEGQLDDRFGQGSAQRKYELIYDDQFLVGRHTSVRLPQELSPQGDFHRELSIYSFDVGRNTVVLRQFIIEGFVLQFTCDSKPTRLVCVSENIENGPEMRARLTIEFENKFRFSEKFELAGPGEDLQLLTAITFTRVPILEE